MDIQAMMNAMSESWRRDRSRYHLTLGGVIAFLEKAPPDALVEFDIGGCPGHPHSYRGYYADLAFERREPLTASEFLAMCKDALGSTFEGYKGGDYVMGEDTPLWHASYGTSSDGLAIIGASIVGDKIILTTKKVDD